MKLQLLLGATLVCAAPLGAQTAPRGAAFPLVLPSALDKSLADKTFRLSLKDVTLWEALQELEKQSGVALDFNDSNSELLQLSKRLTLDVNALSYSEALLELMDAAGVAGQLEKDRSAQPWELTFYGDDIAPGAPRSGQGPFQLRLGDLILQRRQWVAWDKNNAPVRGQTASLRLSLWHTPDPLLPLLVEPEVRLTRADDENGRSLLPAQAPAPSSFRERFINYNAARMWVNRPFLQAPPASSRTLAHLEGVAVYIVPTARERWEVPDLLGAQNLAHGFQSGQSALHLEIRDAKRHADAVEFRPVISSSNASGDDFDLNLVSQRLDQTLRCEQANGEVLLPLLGGLNRDNGTVQVEVRFTTRSRRSRAFFVEYGQLWKTPAGETGGVAPLAPGPLKIVFDAPTQWVRTEVPFSFSDLRLP